MEMEVMMEVEEMMKVVEEVMEVIKEEVEECGTLAHQSPCRTCDQPRQTPGR